MIDEKEFKTVMGSFCTGVTIVTMKSSQDGYHGLTVSSFTSVSLNPPLVLFCRKNIDTSQKALVAGDKLAINILSKDQQDTAYKFANSKLNNKERFQDTEYQLSDAGIPLLLGSKSIIEAEVTDHVLSGDHTIFICQVTKLHYKEELEPMIYYSGKFHDLMTPTSA